VQSWIQQALENVDAESLEGVVAHAEGALVDWPDALREGHPWHKGSPHMNGPRWRLVRALEVRGPFGALPGLRSLSEAHREQHRGCGRSGLRSVPLYGDAA